MKHLAFAVADLGLLAVAGHYGSEALALLAVVLPFVYWRFTRPRGGA